MSKNVFFDIKCNKCDTIVQNHYAIGGLQSYGTCNECKEGDMIRLFSPISFSFKTPPETASRGVTKNGQKWEVGSKPKSYNPATGSYK